MPLTLDDVAPELRGPLRRSPRIPMDRAWARALVRALTGRMRPTATTGVAIEASTSGAPGVRVYRPGVVRSPAALLWIHGGGMIIGSATQDDRLCGSTARRLGIVVVSVEYRLAPEHPFPVPVDDALAGWHRLLGEAGVDPARLAVGGQSAGGGIAAGLVQRLHDAGGAQPAAQWLFCPMLDDRTAARHDLDAQGHFVWTNRLNRFGWGAYLDAEPGRPDAPPYAVPARREDLAGLPPAWIGVGDIDLFHAEDARYADALRAAGVPTTFTTVPGAPHGFEAWAPRAALSAAYVRGAQDWLAEALGAPAVD